MAARRTTRPRGHLRAAARRAVERVLSSPAGSWYFLHVANPVDAVLLRVTRGRLSIELGQRILLLEHIGARTGVRRSTPLLYTPDADALVLVASNGGSSRHPAWYHNVRAHPRVGVLARGRSGDYLAREAESAERERLWSLVNEHYSGYDVYQGRSGGRRIPLVVLERA